MHLSLRYQIPWLNVMCLILKYFDFLIFELWYYVIVRSWNFWNSSNNKLEILSTQQECFCSWEKIKEVFLLKKVLKKRQKIFWFTCLKEWIFFMQHFYCCLRCILWSIIPTGTKDFDLPNLDVTIFLIQFHVQN